MERGGLETSRPLRIALVGENYYPTVGGIQEHIHHLATFLKSRGHKVTIVTGRPRVARWIGPPDDERVVRVGHSIRYGVMGTYTYLTMGPDAALRLHNLLRNRRFDLVHVHGPFDVGLPMLVYLLYRGALVATLHSAFRHTPSRTVLTPYYRWVAKRLDRIIAVSELAASTMRRYANFPYQVIPNGVDVETFARGKKIPRFDDGRRNILYLGRMEPRNGLDLLLAALPLICDEHKDVRLIAAGDGPYLERYKAMVPHDHEDRVVFLGAVSNEARPDLYASADLFVLPARFGGSFSIMVLEALAAGVPVVSTPFVSPEHRDSHWRPVKTTDAYTPEAIARSVCEALREDSTERVEMGRRIVEEYDWSRIGEKILGVYRALLEERS